MPDRKYKRIRVGLGMMYVCQDCSSVVESKEQHENWHQRLVDCIKLAVWA